jgi:hypothetical protein
MLEIMGDGERKRRRKKKKRKGKKKEREKILKENRKINYLFFRNCDL